MTHHWTCRCGERWPRSKQKCTCGRARPKRRVAAHARTLRDDSYDAYATVAREIHGVHDEACCVCLKPRPEQRRHDRDHDHATGNPRGLACGGNSGCNALMPSHLTLARARLIVAYLERVDAHYAARGELATVGS